MPAAFDALPDWFRLTAVIVLGACVGSFLNVAIHRLPRNQSVNDPKWSFCPHCGRTIPWYRNLPILTWILQRGRSACCDRPIAPRYLVVEALTALLFGLAWWHFGWPLGLLLLPWLALLVLGTFIDLEHLLLPDLVTFGGLFFGLAASAAVPLLHETTGWWSGLRESLIGAACGFLLMAAIWQAGKWAFGRLKVRLAEPEIFVIEERNGAIVFALGEESLSWDQIFARSSDRLVIEAEDWRLLRADGSAFAAGEHSTTLSIGCEEIEADGQTHALRELDRVEGRSASVVVPREAMGFGDVLLVAMIGAWTGWEGTLFALGAGAILGLIVGLPARLAGSRGERNLQLPFGPFLAAAGVLWMFAGAAWVSAYVEALDLGY